MVIVGSRLGCRGRHDRDGLGVRVDGDGVTVVQLVHDTDHPDEARDVVLARERGCVRVSAALHGDDRGGVQHLRRVVDVGLLGDEDVAFAHLVQVGLGTVRWRPGR